MSTLCLSDVTACDQTSQAYMYLLCTHVFAYCKQSNTGGGNGLGTRPSSHPVKAGVKGIKTTVRSTFCIALFDVNSCYTISAQSGSFSVGSYINGK